MTPESHRVQFSGSNVIFDFNELSIQCLIDDESFNAVSVLDFMELDLSGQINRDPSFVEIPHDISFAPIQSKAILYLPIDIFQDVFLINVRKQDVIHDHFDDIYFALDETKWGQNNYVIPFHDSYVDISFALNPRSRLIKQNIQNDYIRSIFFDVTGSLKFSALFNNITDLLNHMKLLDHPIDNVLKNVLSLIGGKKDQPLTNHDISNNPVRDFLYGILNSTNYKLYRKHKLLDDLSSKMNVQQSEQLLRKYYIQGFSYRGYGYYYPVYINKHHPDLYIGYKRIRFAEYAGKDFYVNPITLNQDLQDASSISQNMFDYQTTVRDVFVSLPFCYGDGIRTRLTYFPKSSIFANAVVHPRIYEVTLIFSLESHVDLRISNLNEDTSFTELDESNNELIVQGNGRLELLWLGSEDRSSFAFSHYHYYPNFEDILDINITMQVNTSNESAIGFVIFTRPRKHETLANEINYDKVVFFVPDTSLNVMQTYSLNDFHILLNDTILYTSFVSFKETRLYLNEPIHYYGSSQLLSLSLGGKYDLASSMDCILQSAYIYLKHGRTISLR